MHLNSGETTCHWSEVRQAYREAVAAAGLSAQENPVIEVRGGGGTVEAGYEAARIAWERPVKPTGLVAGNDLIAIGALRLLQDRGVRVPSGRATSTSQGVTIRAVPCTQSTPSVE